MAQAMLVLFTADDLAQLKERFWEKSDEKTYEKDPTPQPRQNVLIEAGMGLGMCEQRTILMKLEHCRPASNFEELDCVDLEQSDWFECLRSKLENAGCDVIVANRKELDAAISNVKALVRTGE